MYRKIINEKVAGSVALAPAMTTRVTAIGATIDFARVVLNSVRRMLTRTRLAHQLSLLDNRLLADIGLSRVEISRIADSATAPVGEPTVFQAFSRMVFALIVQPVLRYRHRHHIYNILMSLDDRMLADIGLNRYEVADYVSTLEPRNEPAQSLLAAAGQDIVAPLRAWNRARETARQLARLDDRMLIDIGIVRGDIDWVAGEIARRTITAANGNQPSRPTPRAA